MTPSVSRPSFPEMYEQWLVGSLFAPWAEVLIDRVALPPNGSLLDVACGTGIVARLARSRMRPPGRVVGVDANPQMLDVAKTVAPAIDWIEGRAEALPFAGPAVFDVVLCQQGFQFVPDKPAAAREMRRVARPGGWIGIATWRPLDETPFFREMHQVAQRHLGPIADSRHGFADAGALAGVLADAGFEEIAVETAERTLRFPNTMLVHLNAMALAGMGLKGRDTTEEERDRFVALIVDEALEAVSDYREGEGLTFQSSTNIAVARA